MSHFYKSALLYLVIVLLSGCASLPDKLTMQYIDTDDQVLSLETSERKPEILQEDITDLPENLRTLIVKIKDSAKDKKVAVFSLSDIKSFSKFLLEDMPLLLNSSKAIADINSDEKKPKGTKKKIKTLFFYYYKAYFNGKFVTRQGIVLAKPTAKINFTDNKLTGSVDNDTLTGFITVFLEAVYDYIYAMPVLYSAEMKENYIETYEPIIITSEICPTLEFSGTETCPKLKFPSGVVFAKYYKKEEVSKNNYFNDTVKAASDCPYFREIKCPLFIDRKSLNVYSSFSSAFS